MIELKEYTLGEIAHFVEEKISSSSISLEEYVTTDSLLKNKRGKTIAQNLPPQSCSLTHFRKGDVLIGNIRPYLKKIWYADSDGGCSLDVLVLRANDSNYSTFLYALLLQDDFFEYVMKASKGSKMPRGDKEHILSFPCLCIQNIKEIGDFFVTIDRKIALNRAINRNLEAIIKDTTDKLFLSRKNELKMNYIGNIASIKAGGDCPEKYTLFPTDDCSIPIYSNGTENEGLYGYTSQSMIEGRSITIAARGTIGYCVRRYGRYVPIIRLLSVCPYDIGADTYLHQIITRMTFKKNGSVQQQLTVPELSAIQIPYPSKEQLSMYDKITFPLVLRINHNKEENKILTKQRNELLPLLMNGQVTIEN